jgi:rubredoxin
MTGKQSQKRGNLRAFINTDTNNTFKEGRRRMSKYACQICGYTYDPAKGDPENGINSGTRFEDLPGDWVCPLCGASKDMFKKVD